jgi:thiol-disulfide isomerase/thioredoxin
VRVPASAKVSVNATASTWAFDEMKGDGVPHGDAASLSGLIGQEAPDFTVDLLEGEPFVLSQHLKKKVIVLDFWATWCGPCRQAMPEVMAAVDAFDPDEVMLIAVNQNESAAKVQRFLGAQGWENLTVGLDKGAIHKQYQVQGIPTSVIIGRNGKVVMVHTGYHEGLEDALKEDINAAMKAE